MNRDETRLAEDVLRRVADAYPLPVHFGYLGLALNVSSCAMLRALQQLRRDGLMAIDRSLAVREVPYAQLRITAKGWVAAGMADAADEDAEDLSELGVLMLDRLVAKRVDGGLAPHATVVSGESDRPYP